MKHHSKKIVMIISNPIRDKTFLDSFTLTHEDCTPFRLQDPQRVSGSCVIGIGSCVLSIQSWPSQEGYLWVSMAWARGKEIWYDPRAIEELVKLFWRRSFIEPGIGLRMKRTNRKTRVPIGLYPCHIEENMAIKEVKGESFMEWKTKVITKEGVVIQFPGKFRGYKLLTEEDVEENEGLKEVWEKMEYVISDSDSDLESTASS
ncbi:hypothetical protein Tco_0039429 [Tanacetum coccineum]